MKFPYFAVFFLSSAINAFAQDTTRILFIGNSLTYFNKMPQIVGKMLEESGKTVKIYQKTNPGMTLKMHFDIIDSNGDRIDGFQLNRQTFQQIKFDYIIIQEATVRLLIPHLREEFFAIAHSFNKLAQESGGQLLFYEPYPTYQYPKTHCLPDKRSADMSFSCADEMLDSAQELAVYARICTDVKQENQAQIVPIGRGFEETRKIYPAYNLLADKQHPSILDSYLIAYAVYRSIQKESFLNTFNFIENADKTALHHVFAIVNKLITKNQY